MNRKRRQSIYHANVNVNLMEEILIHFKSRIMINVDVSVKIRKNIIYAKKIIFGILLHVVANMVNTEQASIIHDSVTTSDEIIDTNKTVPTNFNEKR